MKGTIGAAFAFTLVSGTVLAQQAAPSPPPEPQSTDAPDAKDMAPTQPPAGRERGLGGMEGERGWRRRIAPPSKAARFRIETGDATLAMKCPDDEPLKACADFTLQLLDKVGSMTRR